MMKKILYMTIVAATLLSCGALEEKPNSFVNREQWYKTTVQCRTAVNSCYYDYHDICVDVGIFFAIEGQTDLFFTDYEHVDAKLDVSPSYCTTSEKVWTNCYQGIMKCNEIVWCIENPEICKLEESKKMPYAAEARVMRAYYYYTLTNMFGGVPFYLYPVDDKHTMEKIRQLPRTDPNEIRQALYADLRDNALPYLPQERTCNVQGNRAGYALALMLMGKFALWFESYGDKYEDMGALAPLKDLEALYGEFTEERYPLADIRGKFKNTPESIFELQNEYDLSGVTYTCKWAYVAQPRKINGYDGVDMKHYFGDTVIHGEGLEANPYYAGYRTANGNTNGENTSEYWQSGLFNPLPLRPAMTLKEKAASLGLSEAEAKARGYQADYPGEDIYEPSMNRRYVALDTVAIRNMKKDGKPLDRRLFYKLGIFGEHATYNKAGDVIKKEWKIFNNVKTNGRPWAGPQFWRENQRSNSDGNNYKLMRYADALLMMAECYCMNGDLKRADEYVRKIRRRAFGFDNPLPYSTQDEMLSNIMDERARELGGELHRKWDLVRWGIWYDRVYGNTVNPKLKAGMRRYHEYYPIPDVQCALSNYVLKNEAYEK